MQFGPTTDLVEIPISWSLDDHPHFEFIRSKTEVLPGLSNANAVLENWLADFDYMQRTTDAGMLVYTFHPYVIGRGHRMLMLEKLIDGLARRGAVFASLAEIHARFLASGTEKGSQPAWPGRPIERCQGSQVSQSPGQDRHSVIPEKCPANV